MGLTKKKSLSSKKKVGRSKKKSLSGKKTITSIKKKSYKINIETRVDGLLKGGGALGVAYAGALTALEKNGIWFERVSGISAGAIVTSMIAAGYNAQEIDYITAPKDARLTPPSKTTQMLKNKGIAPLDVLSFYDSPTPNEITRNTKRNNMIYYAISGSLRETFLTELVSMTERQITKFVSDMVNAINEKIPGRKNSAFRTFVKVTVKEVITKKIKSILKTKQLKNLVSIKFPKSREMFADMIMDYLLEKSYDEAQSKSGIEAKAASLIFYMSLLQNNGGFKGEKFLSDMRAILNAKIHGDPLSKKKVTFDDLKIPFATFTTDFMNGKLVSYSSEDSMTKRYEVAQAVRESMSIPFVFAPAKSKDKREMWDGGVLENFPIWVYLIPGNGIFENDDDDMERTKLAFFLDDNTKDVEKNAKTNPLLFAAFPKDLLEREVFKRIQILLSLIPTHSVMQRKMIEVYGGGNAFDMHEVSIDMTGFNWLDFDIDGSQYKKMAARGWDATINTIKEKNIIVDREIVEENPYE